MFLSFRSWQDKTALLGPTVRWVKTFFLDQRNLKSNNLPCIWCWTIIFQKIFNPFKSLQIKFHSHSLNSIISFYFCHLRVKSFCFSDFTGCGLRCWGLKPTVDISIGVAIYMRSQLISALNLHLLTGIVSIFSYLIIQTHSYQFD